jgi:hypothetical protein
MINENETVRSSLLRDRSRVVLPSFREDEDVVGPGVREDVDLVAPAFNQDVDLPAPAVALQPATTAEERSAAMEQVEREAIALRFRELDRRSESLAAEQQRVFAERLDAAIAAEIAQLRERRQHAEARLHEWEATERTRISADLAAEEQRFGERLMRQLNEFEAQLGARLREQEVKLDGWWREAERLAGGRMQAAIDEVDATAGI